MARLYHGGAGPATTGSRHHLIPTLISPSANGELSSSPLIGAQRRSTLAVNLAALSGVVFDRFVGECLLIHLQYARVDIACFSALPVHASSVCGRTRHILATAPILKSQIWKSSPYFDYKEATCRRSVGDKQRIRDRRRWDVRRDTHPYFVCVGKLASRCDNLRDAGSTNP